MGKKHLNTYVIAILGNENKFSIESYTPKEAVISLMAKCNCKVKSITPTKDHPNVLVTKLVEYWGERENNTSYQVVLDKGVKALTELHEFLTEEEISAILKKYNVYFGYDLWDKTDVEIPVPKGNVKHLEFYPDSIQRGYDDFSDATVAISYPKNNIQALTLSLQELKATHRINRFDESLLLYTLESLINTLKKKHRG